VGARREGTDARRNASAVAGCEWGLTMREGGGLRPASPRPGRRRCRRLPCARALDPARLWSLRWGIARAESDRVGALRACFFVTAYRVASGGTGQEDDRAAAAGRGRAGRGSRSHHTLTWPTRQDCGGAASAPGRLDCSRRAAGLAG